MREITITRHGGPDVLEIRERPDPDPGPGEARVRVRACGFNFAELMARQGLYTAAPQPPCVVGYEAAGVVDAVGEGVEQFEPGDRVIAAVNFGAHADTLVAGADQLHTMPEEMSFEEGAAIPVNYLTAYHMLFRVAHLKDGESLLVHMAAGGVGTAVLQLCQTVENVELFGTASPGKHEGLRERGCDHPIDYRNRDYAEEVRRITDGEGVDVVLDPLGGTDWKKGYELLRSVGRLVVYGFANMVTGARRNWFNIAWQYLSMPRWHPMRFMTDNKTVSGVNLGRLWDRVDLLREEMEALVELYEQGVVRPRIDSTIPFKNAARAHRRMHDRENVGKIILVPGDDASA